MIGPASIPALDAFLRDDAIDPLDRTAIPECLERIAKDHSTAAKTCVDVLLRQLEKHETNDPTLNAILVLALVNLETTEAIDAIRATFAKDRVDISVFGDLEDVEISLGIRKKRSTPRPRYNIFPDLAPLDADEFSDIPAIPVRRSAKIGRNDPCPCGSGKKYKKCCLRKNQSILAGEEKKPWTMLS
jgi:preprotein translocase subunit SecA